MISLSSLKYPDKTNTNNIHTIFLIRNSITYNIPPQRARERGCLVWKGVVWNYTPKCSLSWSWKDISSQFEAVLLTLPPKFLSNLRSLASSPRFNRAKLQVQLQNRAKMQPPTITFLEVSLLRGGRSVCPLDTPSSYVSDSLAEASFLRSCNMELK